MIGGCHYSPTTILLLTTFTPLLGFLASAVASASCSVATITSSSKVLPPHQRVTTTFIGSTERKVTSVASHNYNIKTTLNQVILAKGLLPFISQNCCQTILWFLLSLSGNAFQHLFQVGVGFNHFDNLIVLAAKSSSYPLWFSQKDKMQYSITPILVDCSIFFNLQ